MAFDASGAASEDGQQGGGGGGGGRGGQGLDPEMEAAMMRLVAERSKKYEAEKAVRALRPPWLLGLRRGSALRGGWCSARQHGRPVCSAARRPRGSYILPPCLAPSSQSREELGRGRQHHLSLTPPLRLLSPRLRRRCHRTARSWGAGGARAPRARCTTRAPTAWMPCWAWPPRVRPLSVRACCSLFRGVA